MANWSAAAGAEHGPYAAWEAALEGPGRLVPVFLELVKPAEGGLSLKAAIQALQTLPQLQLSAHERDLLATEAAKAGPNGWPHVVRAVAYAARADVGGLPNWCKVLGLGPGFLPGEPPLASGPGQDLTQIAGDLSADMPVMGVIDEGIGFLNARFRKARESSRFLGLWMQAAETRAQGPVAPLADIRLGRVLTGQDIDAHLAAGGDEAEIYRQVNRAIYPVGVRAATERQFGHGTHVLDIACGAALAGADAMRAVPILAVQLPPQSIADTAGRRMEAHVIQGLRWILAEALRRAHFSNVPPVVVNLSIGSLAGPGDRGEFLADWLRYEIARHARLGNGAELRLTGAYGNARLSRLAARAELRLAKPMVLDWRVQPDDRSSSFLELRVEQGKEAGLLVKLAPPPGSGLPVLVAAWPQGAMAYWLHGPQGPVAAVSFAPESGQVLAHLALAPTVGTGGPPQLAPPGLWKLTVSTTQAEPVLAVARVQRDDTPVGHAPFGRQSWLDHPEAWGWEPETRDYTAPGNGAGLATCPVTREGTAVNFAGVDHPAVYLVGANMPVPGAPGQRRPSPYSSQGATHLRRAGESAGPGLTAPGDDGHMLAGIRAAGVASGSVVRLSGTSMAAPAVARRLLDYFRSTPKAQRSAAAETAALLGPGPLPAQPDARRGLGALV